MECVQRSPGGNIDRSQLFIRPDVLYNDHDGDIPGSHHAQCTAMKNDNSSDMIIVQDRSLFKPKWGNTPSKSFVPGILLKANLFGDGQRKNNQDCSNNDGKFAVGVPVATDCAIGFMSRCSNHCNKKQELQKKKPW